MKVLLATDGSKHALDAIESFVDRLAWFREPPAVELVHVHLPIPVGRAVAWAGKEAVERYYAEEADAALAPAKDLLARREIAFHAAKLVGEPGHEIVRHAEAAGCDLIVVGTHGRTGIARVVLGSIAEYLVRHADCAVVSLRGGPEQREVAVPGLL